MKLLVFVCLVTTGLLSCTSHPQPSAGSVKNDTGSAPEHTINTPADTLVEMPPYSVGDTIQGDFNGDGKKEMAYQVKIKEEVGSPMEDGTSAEYAIFFSDKQIPVIPAGCCDAWLINEGDLNKNGKDELSFFRAPMNGCTYTMCTYTLRKDKWATLIEPFLVPTGCETTSYEDMQKRVFLENGTLYYYDIDPNDEQGKLIKTKAVLLQ